MINGKAINPFRVKKGVTQGDPLSSFLFVLDMEYLTRVLKTLHTSLTFHYHPKCKKQQIIQIRFVDDLFLFYMGDVKFV